MPKATASSRLRPLHERFMRIALCEAARGGGEGEVPVGAVLVHEGRVVARAHNRPLHLLILPPMRKYWCCAAQRASWATTG